MGPLQEATLYKGQPTTSATALATVPTGQDWVIDNVIVCNESSSTSDTLTLDIVSVGGTAGAGTKLADAVTFAANATAFIGASTRSLGIVLKPGDFISGLQSASGNFNVFVTGRIREH